MADQEQRSSGSEIAELNRILQKVLAKEPPTDEELDVLRRLRVDVVDLFDHSRRVDRL